MMNEPIRSIMTTDLVTLTPDNTLGEARDILMQRHIHHLPIVEGKKLVGLISSYDLFKLGHSASEYAGLKIEGFMTRRLATLEPDQKVGAAAELLMEHLFHAVPIVDEHHNLVGIVTTYDLLRYEFRKEYPESLEKFVSENM